MRGKHHARIPQRHSGRNIPAYAGKTATRRLVPIAPAEHPRVCGENCPSRKCRKRNSGTSPRMRGKRTLGQERGHPLRNIPAYAGKTCSGAGICSPRWEHPRVCGENAGEPCWNAASAGTSPRMRGKHPHRNPLGLRQRNIPAYAGKTENPQQCYLGAQEHPRVCGENGLDYNPTSQIPGTSPRMRGKRLNKQAVTQIVRNIPAYAGKTG